MINKTQVADEYISADEVCELIPGMTKGNLSQLRFRSQGPRYYKPSDRLIIYKKREVLEWLDSTARTGTTQGA